MKNLFCDSSNLTNEASVEKYFVDRLLTALGYADGDIAVKTSLKEIKVGKGAKSELYKPDYMLLDRHVPVVVVDAKGPKEDIRKWALQCSSYCLELNKKFDYNPVRYYLISNGFATSVFQWDKEDPLLNLSFKEFEASNQKYKELKALISKKSLSQLIEEEREESEQSAFAFEKVPLDELLGRFQKIHQYIWKKEKKKPSSVFEELMKLVFVKIRKDKELHSKYGASPKPLKMDVVFSVGWIDEQTQSENPINDILFRNLVNDLEAEITAHRKKRIFDTNEEIDLAPDTIRWVVSQLEHIDLFGMEEDVHGRMFESFLEATVRGKELGQFFTPRDIVRLMVGLADISVTRLHQAKVLDACCGSGGFLIQAMSSMLTKAESIPGLSNTQRHELENRIRDGCLFGIDAGSDPKIYRLARMNMYLHGDGGSNIYFADSLDKRIVMVGKPSIEYRQEIHELHNILLRDRTRFDVILSNPPFSLKYSDDDKEQAEVMEQYDLFELDGRIAKSLLSSVMFLERYKELISQDGRILTIIDESVLSGDSYRSIRDWIRKTFIIEGVISLPGDAFKRCAARVKTSILILRLKQEGEDQPDVFLDYAVRLGLERKVAKRIGISVSGLDADKEAETNRILEAFLAFKRGTSRQNVYPASAIADRLDVKFCIQDNGRKKPIWINKGRTPVAFKRILGMPPGRQVDVAEDEEYQFLRVNYQGDVIDGDIILGSDCAYSHLFEVKEWDILISNMGVGRGAIGIVPPYHEGKFVSNEYTILRANSKEEAVYYSNLVRTKEILGDVLSNTTGMNRGRIDWDTIGNVEVPEYLGRDPQVAELVRTLESMWQSHATFSGNRKMYLDGISGELELNGADAQERWLGFKPPE
jgi:type I restriction enzyme M protein